MNSTLSPETSASPFAATLTPLRDGLPRSIVEREILRVVSTVPSQQTTDALSVARREVLSWARNRSGGELPPQSWHGAAFETLAAGRTTMAVSVEIENSLLWSLRGDDPDRNVPGRIWSTEVSLGQSNGSNIVLLGVRLLVNSMEAELTIEPSVPGLVLQIADRCGLRDGPVPVWSLPHYAETEEHAETLVDWLLSGDRRLPIVVASGDERSEFPDQPLVDTELLAKALCGLAHIVCLPAKLTYKLSDLLGKSLSVFHGGVRVYQPCLDTLADSRDHRLYLGAMLTSNPSPIEPLSQISRCH